MMSLEYRGSELSLSRTGMLRQRLLVVATLGAVACAQIAGFDDLSSKQPSSNDEAGSAGSASSGGKSSNAAGSSNGATSSAGTDSLQPSAGESSSGGVAGGAGRGGGAGTATGGTSAGAQEVGGCNRQLLLNADFDAGATEWTLESTTPGILDLEDVILEDTSERLSVAQVAPASGHWLAWLGGNSDAKPTKLRLLQKVHIPENVSKLQVSFQLWIDTEEPDPDPEKVFDRLDLQMEDDVDSWSFDYWSVDDVSTKWHVFTREIVDAGLLDAWRGTDMSFVAESKSDTGYATAFWIDSLVLTAQCP
jgi:hypothetical protein